MRQTLCYALLCHLGMLLAMARCNRATKSSQESLLLQAAIGNDTKTVVTLLKGVGSINIQDNSKLTPLHHAVRHDNEAMVVAQRSPGACQWRNRCIAYDNTPGSRMDQGCYGIQE